MFVVIDASVIDLLGIKDEKHLGLQQTPSAFLLLTFYSLDYMVFFAVSLARHLVSEYRLLFIIIYIFRWGYSHVFLKFYRKIFVIVISRHICDFFEGIVSCGDQTDSVLYPQIYYIFLG